MAMQTFYWVSGAERPSMQRLREIGYTAHSGGEWHVIVTDAPESVVWDECRRAGKPRWMACYAVDGPKQDSGIVTGLLGGIPYSGWEEWPEG